MRYLIKILILTVLLSETTCKESNSRTVPATDTTISVQVVAGNLNHVWELAWSADNKLWFTEREGRISLFDPATGNVKRIFEIDEVVSRGEGGLLGMALHPDFPAIPELFVVYDYLQGGSYREKVVKYTFTGNSLINPVVLVGRIAASNIHNGSRLSISPDKKLFITTGDASEPSRSQNLNSLNGKVLRINLDGSIPSDNPFPGSPVWSFGHRNPQGLTWVNGKLFSSEHGPNNDDEINIIEKGKNYGWPNVEGFCNTSDEQSFCKANAVIEPIYTWTPTIAVCGLAYYDHSLIPQWKNSLLLATLKGSSLYLLKLNSSGTAVESVSPVISETYGRLRAVCVSPDGKVYFSTSNGDDDRIISISAGK